MRVATNLLENLVVLLALGFIGLVGYSCYYFMTTPIWYYDGCSFMGYHNVIYETPTEHYGYWIIPILPLECLVNMPIYWALPGLLFCGLASWIIWDRLTWGCPVIYKGR